MSRFLFFCILGYLSGSVMYAYLIPLWCGKGDIRSYSDDHNPGTANAFKYAGRVIGIVVILCELLKGFIPVYLAGRYVDTDNMAFALVMIAPVMGHAFPLYGDSRLFGMKGGKSIAVSFGVTIALYPEIRPLLFLIFFYLLFSLVIKIYTHFYRSIITFALFSGACILFVAKKSVVLGCVLDSVIVVSKHLEKFENEKFSIVFRRKGRQE